MINLIPEPRLVASGFCQMTDTGGDNMPHVQGCTVISGGTGIVIVTLLVPFPPVEEMEIFAFPLAAPSEGVTLNAGNPGSSGVFSIVARQASGVSAGALINVPLTFRVNRRGKLG